MQSLLLYDSAYLYLSILNDTLARGLGHPDGRTFQKLAASKSFEGT